MEAAGNALADVLADDALRARLSKAALETGKDLTWDRRAEKLEGFIRARLR
jgi:glycosyltransferase involved in cell wall biosynthesis